MKRYLYKNKKTGERLSTDTPKKGTEWILIKQIKDGQMKAHQIRTK